MRKLAILASVIGLAAGSANCSDSPSGANSTSNIFPSLVSPSALAEARAPGNGNGKGGSNGANGSISGSSLAYVLVNDVNGNHLPNWGDSVTFTVVTTVTTETNVELLCSQNGVFVYGAVWPLTPNPILSSTAWQSGAADCTATLYSLGDRKSVLATTAFTAGA